MHIPTCIGIHRLWVVLSWPWDWNTDRWLLNTVVIVIKERNTLRDVIGSCWDAIAVEVWRNKRLHMILWPLKTVLISWPLSQAVWAFPLRQVAHYCVVLWVQQHRVLLWSITNSVFIHMESLHSILCASSLSPESLPGQKAQWPLQAMPYRQQHSVYVVLRPWRGSEHMLSPSRRCQQISMCTSSLGSRVSGWHEVKKCKDTTDQHLNLW